MTASPHAASRPADAAPAICLENVSYAFGAADDPTRTLALRETSITINDGEFVCLIGPSGCGKSTLLNIMGGLLLPQTGRVLVRGKPLSGPRPREVAFVFQDSTLFPWRNVLA